MRRLGLWLGLWLGLRRPRLLHLIEKVQELCLVRLQVGLLRCLLRCLLDLRLRGLRLLLGLLDLGLLLGLRLLRLRLVHLVLQLLQGCMLLLLLEEDLLALLLLLENLLLEDLLVLLHAAQLLLALAQLVDLHLQRLHLSLQKHELLLDLGQRLVLVGENPALMHSVLHALLHNVPVLLVLALRHNKLRLELSKLLLQSAQRHIGLLERREEVPCTDDRLLLGLRGLGRLKRLALRLASKCKRCGRAAKRERRLGLGARKGVRGSLLENLGLGLVRGGVLRSVLWSRAPGRDGIEEGVRRGKRVVCAEGDESAQRDVVGLVLAAHHEGAVEEATLVPLGHLVVRKRALDLPRGILVKPALRCSCSNRDSRWL